jgi:hypothetical protein
VIIELVAGSDFAKQVLQSAMLSYTAETNYRTDPATGVTITSVTFHQYDCRIGSGPCHCTNLDTFVIAEQPDAPSPVHAHVAIKKRDVDRLF